MEHKSQKIVVSAFKENTNSIKTCHLQKHAMRSSHKLFVTII